MTKQFISFVGIAIAMALVSYGAKYVIRDTITSRHIWQSALVGVIFAILWHIPWKKGDQEAK